MIEHGRADLLAPLERDELDTATLALLDSVSEYEARAAGVPPRTDEDPTATLW